jgi:hypothetical protein
MDVPLRLERAQGFRTALTVVRIFQFQLQIASGTSPMGIEWAKTLPGLRIEPATHSTLHTRPKSFLITRDGSTQALALASEQHAHHGSDHGKSSSRKAHDAL